METLYKYSNIITQLNTSEVLFRNSPNTADDLKRFCLVMSYK